MVNLRVVLDTNVIVSAHLNGKGLERYILDLALNRQLIFFLTEGILAEYRDVLYRPRFKFPKAMISDSLKLIERHARLVRPKNVLAVANDPADNKFLECAEAAKADYLVTGNKRHFPSGWKTTRVVNARELLNLIVPNVPAV